MFKVNETDDIFDSEHYNDVLLIRNNVDKLSCKIAQATDDLEKLELDLVAKKRLHYFLKKLLSNGSYEKINSYIENYGDCFDEDLFKVNICDVVAK